MVRALGATLLVSFLSACDAGPAGPVVSEGLCVAVVNVGGVFFSPTSVPSVSQADVSEVFLHVTRNTGCLDTGQPADPLAHGESNFLDAGPYCTAWSASSPTRGWRTGRRWLESGSCSRLGPEVRSSARLTSHSPLGTRDD